MSKVRQTLPLKSDCLLQASARVIEQLPWIITLASVLVPEARDFEWSQVLLLAC